ncbi:unnamed protein product [Durusdinium trenchii]|uniref:Fibronectin type-III domain-containing protein n=1 Tax=Durusdinium trenchii TaxID=1381693 RepID=A0ABP0LKE8_9DINO
MSAYGKLEADAAPAGCSQRQQRIRGEDRKHWKHQSRCWPQQDGREFSSRRGGGESPPPPGGFSPPHGCTVKAFSIWITLSSGSFDLDEPPRGPPGPAGMRRHRSRSRSRRCIRTDMRRSAQGGQRRPSGREADRPSAPLRVQIAGASHEVAGAEKKPMVLLELKGISFEDLTDYRIQWRSLLPWVLEKDGTDIKDFSEDAYLHDPFLAVPLQLPGLIQLRMFQKKFPDNIAAWNDWCRAAKKEMEWLWRSCDPFPVHLPAPNPLGVSLEVSEEDGASLVVFLSFALPRDVSVPDDVPLHWQYRWRDATFGHGQEDCCVDSFETLLKERGTPRVRSPALRGDWECTSVIFSVRYLLGSSWSAWSDFASGSPNWAPWQGQPKLSISSCGFTKAILSLASPACVGHVKAQIRIEVGQVQGAMQTVLVTERPSFQAQTFTCPLRALRPGNSYTVRVSSRRWRIDHEWQEQLQELQQPLTGSEQGVPPMWALAPGMLEEVHVDGDLDWYPFWLHPIIASWPMDGVSAEWRREAPGEEWWTLTACERSSLHAARQKDARLAKGSGLRILLPKLTTWILVRLRHTCGLVTSSTRIRPSLLPLQEKPLATLVAKDSGLAIQLSLAEDHCGTMIQFMATAESKINKGDVGAQISHELEPCCLRPLADEAPVRHLVDVEELRMSPVEAVAFQARIGDGRQWSAWSPASDLLGLRIAPPVPDRGELTVQELAKGVVEVLWSKFRRLEGLEEVHYEVTATCAGFLQERVCLLSETEATHSGQLAGSCRAVFERLVPDTDYDFVVKGIYPKLKHFTRCAEDAEEAGAASPVLKASLRLKGVDGRDFEPPQAVKQVAPPPLYGGADRRSPYSFEFWIEVDSHVSSSSYVVEWRAWPGETWQAAALKALGQEDGQERPAGSTEPKDSQGLKVEQFIWDCGPSPPEGVELRVRAAAPSMQRSSRGWFSPISGPFATAFAVPEKPKATLLVSEPHLAVAITFALGGPSSVPGPTEPAGPVALGHGHCLARRVQICYRRAGDADEEVVEMKPRELRLQSRSDLSASAENSVPSGGELVMIPATQPRFWEGQRLLFAVRIGDEYRWSAWSSFSKPVHMKHAVLRAAPVSTGLIAKPLSPERVGLQWSSCVALAGVEYMVSMVQFGATGREVKSTGQLMALWAEDGLDREGIELDIDIGRVRPGASLQFRLLARTQRHTLGTPCFEELARSEVLVWPSWSGVSGGAAVSAAGTACLAAESWDLPVPHLLAVPEELDATGRWRGRAVLLSWPKGVPVGDADEVPLELQACCWDAEKEEFSDAHGWVPVSWSLLHVYPSAKLEEVG